MKKSLFILAAALLSFASCSEEELVNVTYPQGNKVLVASFEQDGSATRMNIASNNGLTWTAGDAIAVFGKSAVKYELQGQGGTTGTFKVAEGFSAPSTINGAAFPYDKDASFSSATLTMTLPVTLYQTNAGACNVPMWGTVTGDNIAFKHLAGLLKVDLTNIPAGYNTLTVTASSPIAGEFTVNLEDTKNPVWVSSSAVDAGKTVTVEFTEATKSQVLYLPLPVGTYESIVVSISNDTDTKVLKQWADKTVERAKVYMTSVDYNTYVTEVEDLTKAITNATEGATINLGADITMSEILVIKKGITLNGNGHTITSNVPTGMDAKNWRAINVSGANGVTIRNLTINCSGERGINIIQNATNVTIDNVTIDADNYAVNIAGSAPDAVVTITGSTLTGKNVVNVGGVKAKVTVTDTELTNDNTENDNNQYAILCLNKDATGGSSIAATGCTFNLGTNTVKGRNDTADGTITIDGNTADVAKTVAYIDYGTYYKPRDTFEEIVEVAEAGNTITLIRDITLQEDITLTSKITANTAITLDLNGKTLTENLGLGGEGYPMLFAGNVTIKNGTIQTNSKFPIVIDNSTTRLKGDFTKVTITGTRKDNANNGALILIGNANVAIGTDVNITANHYHCAVESAAIDVEGNGAAEVTISEGATITLQQATESETSTTIGAGYGSTINVTGGTINGLGAKYVASVFPTGGTINISGGTIQGTLWVHTKYTGVETATINVTGGTFSVNPESFVPQSGFETINNDNNTWTVRPASNE